MKALLVAIVILLVITILYLMIGLSNPKSDYDRMIDDKEQENFLRNLNEKNKKRG